MKNFAPYIECISTIALGTSSEDGSQRQFEQLVNGKPYEVFRDKVSLQSRRRKGAFFTSSLNSDMAAALLSERIAEGESIFDPACGIGDLLLACASRLPLESTLDDTLEAWGMRLHGIDLQEQFVAGTKARLIALARLRGDFKKPIRKIDHYFNNIKVGNFFKDQSSLEICRSVVLNPPFTKKKSPKNVSWCSGKTSAAALFIYQLAKASQPGTLVSAILPEVLRCGSSYNAFREELTKHMSSDHLESLGQFDKWTDIDVFLTRLECSERGELWPLSVKPSANKVDEVFDISVGAVVPFRLKGNGAYHPYIEAKDLPQWALLRNPERKIRFKGTVVSGPFVAIRRTSRPGDNYRAIGTVIVSDFPVAVENHLIVARPKDGKLPTCLRLIECLKSDATNSYLDHMMRCRHLTTGAIKNLPWESVNG